MATRRSRSGRACGAIVRAPSSHRRSYSMFLATITGDVVRVPDVDLPGTSTTGDAEAVPALGAMCGDTRYGNVPTAGRGLFDGPATLNGSRRSGVGRSAPLMQPRTHGPPKSAVATRSPQQR